jgi:hypothetical protein
MRKSDNQEIRESGLNVKFDNMNLCLRGFVVITLFEKTKPICAGLNWRNILFER